MKQYKVFISLASLFLILLIFMQSAVYAAYDTTSYTTVTYANARTIMYRNSANLKKLDINKKTAKNSYDNAVTTANKTYTDYFYLSQLHFIVTPKIEHDSYKQKYYAPEVAKYNYEVYDTNISLAKINLDNNLRSIYVSLVSMDYQIDMQKKKIELNREKYQKAQREYEAGVITEENLISYEITLSSSEDTLLSLEMEQKKYRLNLNSLIGTVTSGQYLINSRGEENMAGLGNMDVYIQSALEKRSEVLDLKKQIDFKSQEVELMKKYGFDKYRLNAPDEKEIRETYDTYVDELSDLRSDLKDQEATIEVEIELAYKEIMQAAADIENVDFSIREIQNSYTRTKKLHDLGFVIADLDLKGYLLSIEELENNRVISILNYNSMVDKLKQASGLGPAYN